MHAPESVWLAERNTGLTWERSWRHGPCKTCCRDWYGSEYRKQKTAVLERDVEAGSQILVGQSVKSELVFVRLFQIYLVAEPCSLMFF